VHQAVARQAVDADLVYVAVPFSGTGKVAARALEIPMYRAVPRLGLGANGDGARKATGSRDGFMPIPGPYQRASNPGGRQRLLREFQRLQ